MNLTDRDELLKFKREVYDYEGHPIYAVPTGIIMRSPTVDAVPICWLENLRDRIIIEAMGKCKDGDGVDVTDARCVHRTLELIREGMKKC